MTTTNIRLFRHGWPEGDDNFRGAGEWAITQAGFGDMAWVARNFPKYDVVITPSASRCREFAEWFCEHTSAELEISEGFRERHYGDWDGKLKVDVEREFPELYKQYIESPLEISPPNGELPQDYSNRIVTELERLVKKHEGKNILMVLHGGIMRQVVGHYLNIPLKERGREDFDFFYSSYADLTITEAGRRYVNFSCNLDKQYADLYPDN